MPTKRFHNLDPDKRAAFLEAAAEEFATHGYTGASLNRIIERAGTSKGAMYYYFEDKADLYATVVRDTVSRFVAWCGLPGPIQRVCRTVQTADHARRSDPGSRWATGATPPDAVTVVSDLSEPYRTDCDASPRRTSMALTPLDRGYWTHVTTKCNVAAVLCIRSVSLCQCGVSPGCDITTVLTG